MRIDINEIAEGGVAVEFANGAGDFPVLKTLELEGVCRFVAPLATRLRAERFEDMFHVAGRVATQVRLSCSRCLKRFDRPLTATLDLTFRRRMASTDAERSGSECGEAQSEEMTFTGEELDFTAVVEEHIVLALPFKPLCRQDCRGLCAHCGADLNRRDCSCRKDDQGSPFAVLKHLQARQKADQ
jgi:uncharacterized protein